MAKWINSYSSSARVTKVHLSSNLAIIVSSTEIMLKISTTNNLCRKSSRAKSAFKATKKWIEGQARPFETTKIGKKSQRRSQRRRSYSQTQSKKHSAIDAREATKRSNCLESKLLRSLADFWCRGGIAVVWLGKRDGQSYAMKQFPKQTGNKVDPSAHVELQIHQLIRNNSEKAGKFRYQLLLTVTVG